MIKRTGGQPLTIGFYGDSFCCETSTPHSIAKGYETYIAKLKKHTDAKIVHLGEGGSSVWDVILQQFNPADVPDVCIFCWTDNTRLYNKKIRNMTYGSIKDKKLKDITLLELFHRGIVNAAKHYYNYLYDPDKHELEYKSLLYYFDKEILPSVNSKIIHLWSFENTYKWSNGINISTPLNDYADGNPYAANHINGDDNNTKICNLINNALCQL